MAEKRQICQRGRSDCRSGVMSVYGDRAIDLRGRSVTPAILILDFCRSIQQNVGLENPR